MTAFDTSTNTASVSFTNAYATAVLQESAVMQQVFGFARTTGKRYFEFFVDDGGGPWTTCTKPYVGILGYGASSNLLGPLVPGGATISTGDVFMFSVDFGGGTDHAGNVKYTTVTAGGGNLMSPVFIDIGKNGTWYTDTWGLVNWKYPAFGKTGWEKPALYRIGDGTSGISSSAVTISLRVETTSFAYAIPSGFVAWGDGPEGGGASTLTDAGIYWDPARKSSQMSLSGGNLYAVFNHSYTFTSSLNTDFFYTSALPTTGKRMIEVINRNTATKVIGAIGFGLADEDISITAPTQISTKKIGRPTSYLGFYQRSVGATSITMSFEGQDFYGETPGQVMFVDFDLGRLWHTGGLITGGGIKKTAFAGVAGATIADPYLGTDGITFTNSVGMRFYMESRKDSSISNASVYLNVGQTAFETFPQLPGWISMDGGRRVYGVNDKWDTTVYHAASTTFYASDLAVRAGGGSLFLGTGVRYAGKKYFEIFKQHQQDTNDYVGIYSQNGVTVSATNPVLVFDQGIFFSTRNKRKIRYGVSLTFTPTSSAISTGSQQDRWGIAVDFDAGYIWCGIWNRNDRQMNWTPGANPATGVQPDYSFTPSATFKVAMIMGSASGGGAKIGILVAEDTNVIGLPSGFTTWNGTTSITASATMTPSAAIVGGTSRVLWPYGVQT